MERDVVPRDAPPGRRRAFKHRTSRARDAHADALAAGSYPNLRDLDFSWFPADCTACGGARDGGEARDKEGHVVRVHFSRRDPAQPLEGLDAGKLLVRPHSAARPPSPPPRLCSAP